MTPPETLDQVLLLLTSGLSRDVVLAAAVARLGLDPAAAEAAVAAARLRLTLAAEYNRDEQLGIAITRLHELYANAVTYEDMKTALGAQKELHRLLGLYTPRELAAPDPSSPSPEAAELAAVRAHLCPVLAGLPSQGTAETATPELARLAAAEILRLRGAASE